MSLRINLNSAAQTAHRQLQRSDNAMSKSIERLSSGYKINNAGDDPAGLVISEKLRAQVGGINQAIKNVGDATNIVKTAEGALTEVNSLLGTMRDLAVHAANTGANDGATLQADQNQIKSALDSINKISEETQFGGKSLLNGAAGIKAVVTGDKVISADLSKATLTADASGIDIDLTAGTAQLATKAQLTGTVDLTTMTGAETITINGVTVTAGIGRDATLAAINAVSDQTGVLATADGSDHLVLTQKEYGSKHRIDVTNGAAIYGSINAADSGLDVKATVKYGANNVSDATWADGDGLVLKDSLGNAIQLTEAAGATGPAAVLSNQVDAKVGSMTFQVGAYAGQTRSLSIASVHTSQLGLANSTSITDLSKIDVTTNAKDALTVIDKAISDVSTLRATLGSAQKNTFESVTNSLSIASENISASESSIRDTDMAAEMVNFTRNQIMQQAGTAMLAQANQAPQQLLSLLR